MMTISDLAAILNGQIVCCEEKLGHTIADFAASDLLSDILTFKKDNYALLTGLTNLQVLRTAEIMNACCVVILRNKQPQPALVSLAKRSGIPLVLSGCGMFDACSRIEHYRNRAEPRDGRTA